MTAVDRTDLLDRHAGDVGAMAAWIARRCRQDPADVGQQLWLLILTRIADFDPAKVRFRLWLYRKWLAKFGGRRWRGQQFAEDGPELVGREADPAEAAERADTITAVRNAVAALPDRERVAVADRFGLAGPGRTLGEVAESLGMSRGGCGQMAARGLKRIKARLGPAA